MEPANTTVRRRMSIWWVSAVVGLAALCGHVEAGMPRIEQMSVHGSDKGIALAFTTDKPGAGEVTADAKALSRTAWLIHLCVPNVEYGLPVGRFTSLPSQCPITEISARVRDGGDTTDIVLEALVADGDRVDAKVKGNRILVLVSQEPVSPFSWIAPGAGEDIREGFRDTRDETKWQPAEEVEQPPAPPASEPPPRVAEQKPKRTEPKSHAVQPQPAATEQRRVQGRLACLERVRVIQRGSVAELSFELSEPVVPHVRYQAGRAVLLFPHAANCVGDVRLEPSSADVFKSIELRHRTYAGEQWLGAIVIFGDQAQLPFISRYQGAAIHLMVKPDGEERFTYWSSDRRTGVDVAFRRDRGSSAGERAVKVASPPRPFHRRDKQKPSRPLGYMVAIGDNVNIRTEPRAGTEENIVGRLDRGTTVALVEDRGSWRKIRTKAGVAGWVYGALLASCSATEYVGGDTPLPTRGHRTMARASTFPDVTMGALAAFREAGAETGGAAVDSAEQPPTELRADGAFSGQELIRYAVYGRDPFMPYSRKIDQGVPNPAHLILVGILYDRYDRIALLQDELFKEKSYALRERDPVSHGVVWRINPTSVVFLITELGISRTYTLGLKNVSPTKEQRR